MRTSFLDPSRTIIGRCLTVLASLVLMANSIAPAIAVTLQNPRNHPVKPGPKPVQMKGVPRMDTSMKGLPIRVRKNEQISWLNERTQLNRRVTLADLAIAKGDAKVSGKSAKRADALIHLGEFAMVGREEPIEALGYFDKAIVAAPAGSRERGVAALDHGLAEVIRGAYAEAVGEFGHILRAKPRGANLKLVMNQFAHAKACLGYHQQHANLGITEPKEIDPLCAVASMAVCLRELGLPHDKSRVAAAVRHTGEGSNLQDIMDGAPKLGTTAFAVGTTDRKKLMELPKPMVAHVEHDHFIAVVGMDDDGVRYNCSDCGNWPGGFKHVSWQQWKAMDADAYAILTPQGSPLDLAVRSHVPGAGASVELAILLGGNSVPAEPDQVAAAAQKSAALIETVAFNQLAPFLAPVYPVDCGGKTKEPRCVFVPRDCGCDGPPVQECPMAQPGSGSSFGASDGDPIDLATGEVEYRPSSGLSAYSPIGPAAHFALIYDSLRSDGTPFAPINYGFGMGWSHPYNVQVDYEPNVASGGGGEVPPDDNNCAAQGGGGTGGTYPGQVVLDNGAVIPFTWPTGVSGFNPTTSGTQSVVQTVPNGYPVVVTEYYQNTGPTTWIVVTFPDRTTWTTNASTPDLSPYAVVSMTDRLGRPVYLHYTTYTVGTGSMQLLTNVTDYTGTPLLGFQVNPSTGMYTNVTSAAGTIYFTYDPTYGLLYQVSQVVPLLTSGPPVRYQFTYEWDGNGPAGETFPMLHTITVPSPTGTGTSTHTISYSPFNGLLTGVTDANGNRMTFTAGSTSNQTCVSYYPGTYAAEYKYTVAYDSNMDLTGVYNSAGSSVYSLSYGGADPFRPGSISDGLSHTWDFSWDKFGNLLTATSPKGTTTTNTLTYSNFALGEVTATTTGSLTSTTFGYYEPSGLIHTVSTPVPGDIGTGSHQTTTYSYSALGNLTSVQSPGNNATTYHTTTFGYTTDGTYSQSEAIGEPITITDTLGKVTHLRYDYQGRLNTETDEVGNTWSAGYNLAGQVTGITAPATGNAGTGHSQTTPTYLYVGGPVTSVTAYDESGSAARSVSYTYGLDGEMLSIAGDAETTSVTYGSPYWIKSLTDGNGHTTTYTRGTTSNPTSGDVTQISYPLASGTTDTVQYSYNVMHRPTQRTDGNGVVTNFAYSDGDGLLSAITYPASTGLNVGVTYDAYDRAYYVSDGTGTISNTFDDLGGVNQSVRTYTGLSAKTLTYSRYPDGARSAMTTPAGNFAYFYDSDGRYSSMSSPAGTFSAAYYDNGWEASRTLANGVVTTYGYNAVGGLSSLASTLGSTSISSFSNFSYDGVFNLTGFSANYGSGSSMPNGTRSFGFDSKDRLTASTIPTSSSSSVSSSYGFDGAGNRTSVNSTTIPFNADNQCTSSGMSFDGNGNPTTYAGTSAGYDPENRLVSLGSLSNSYRADGLRANKSYGSSSMYFLYDGGEPIIEMNGSGTVTALNVFAPDGLVARQTSSSTIQYVFDQQGNVAERTDSSGSVLSTTQYDAWGNEQVVSGTVTDPFGYNGQWGYYLDRETGLYLCQHRFYDPGAGRWLNRDPIGYAGGTNLYGYCAGGPVEGSDTSGLILSSLDNPGSAQALAGEGITLTRTAAAPTIWDGFLAWGGNLLRTWGWLAPAGAAAVSANAADPNWPSDAANTIQGVCDLASGAAGGGSGDSNLNPNWMQEAAAKYPNKAGTEENHHPYPLFLGGPVDGPTARLDGASHQVITNYIRELAPYGRPLLDPEEANEVVEKAAAKYPIPPELFNIHFQVP